jgi:hypothetical protein
LVCTRSLQIKYFWETDVYSDDPFTPEVEPAIPFIVGMLINNNGSGTASNVQVRSFPSTSVRV